MTADTLVWILVVIAAVIAVWNAFVFFLGEDIRSPDDRW